MADKTSGVWAVVVARIGPTSKSRLSSVLTSEQRSALASAMLADLLEACRGAGLDGTVAVISSIDGLWSGETHGAHTIGDASLGMNAAVAKGIDFALKRGASAVLILPADLPLARSSDLSAVIAASASIPRAVGVVPDSVGIGTNALFLRPPQVIAPSFEGESARRHERIGRDAGARVVWQTVPRLAVDIDFPEDLENLRNAVPNTATSRLLHECFLTRATVGNG